MPQMDDIVIVAAARTPVGSFNGAFAASPPMCWARAAHPGRDEPRRLEPGEVDEVILGQVLTAGAGPEPGAPGGPQRRHSGRQDRVRHQPGVRLRPARGGAGRAADPHRREPGRGRRRAGEHEHVAARGPSAGRAEDGRPAVGRHHDQGRAVGRLPRLPHGHHGRERGQAPTRSPASSRTRFAAPRSRRPRAAQKAGRFKDEITAGDGEGPQGRHGGGRRRIHPPRQQPPR